MIEFSGSGESDRLFRLVAHHAEGIERLIAPIAVVLLDVLGRTDRIHTIDARRGWNSVNIRLENGEKIALRARKVDGVYRLVRVHRGGFRPLGQVEFEIREPRHAVGKFRTAMKRWAR